jgi:hypothetical protein
MNLWNFFANAATGGAYGLFETGIDAAAGSSSPSDSDPANPSRWQSAGGLLGGSAEKTAAGGAQPSAASMLRPIPIE